VKQLLLRPFLAVLCALALVYDTGLFVINKLRGENVNTVRDRRAHHRGLLDTESGLRILQDLQVIAAETGARLFLVSGTLLGMHRQGRLLEHDYDIDVGVFADDPALPTFVAAMEKFPGRLRTSTTRLNAAEATLNPWLGLAPDTPLLHKFFFQNNRGGQQEHFGIDLFIHYRANHHIVHGSYRCLWINTEHTLVTRNYGGCDFLVPADVVKYLRENYGRFEVENKRFESSVDCPNTTNIYGIRSVMWLTGRFAYFLASNEPGKRRLIQRRLWDYVLYGLFVKSTPNWRINQYES
jgi:hypothetical protein